MGQVVDFGTYIVTHVPTYYKENVTLVNIIWGLFDRASSS